MKLTLKRNAAGQIENPLGTLAKTLALKGVRAALTSAATIAVAHGALSEGNSAAAVEIGVGVVLWGATLAQSLYQGWVAHRAIGVAAATPPGQFKA